MSEEEMFGDWKNQSNAIRGIEDMKFTIAELEADQRRLEWLVDQEASVRYVFGAWSVWFDEETDAGVSGQDWRDVVDHAMKGEEGE